MSVTVDLDLVSGGQVTVSLPAQGATPGSCFVGMPRSGADRVWPIAKALLAAAGRPICDLFECLKSSGLVLRDISPASLNRLLKREGYDFGVVWGLGALGDEVATAGRATVLLVRDPRELVSQSFLETDGVAVADFLRSATVEALGKQYAQTVDFCRRHPHVRIVRAEEAALGWPRLVIDLVGGFDLEIAPDMASGIVGRIESKSAVQPESSFWDRCDAAASAELDARFAEALGFLGYADPPGSAAAGRLKRAFYRQGFRDLASSWIRPPMAATRRPSEAVGASSPGAARPPSNLFENDPELYGRLRPNGSEEVMVLGRRVRMEADASGCRPVLGQPRLGEKTVAVYGCSFTFGAGVNFDETFCSRLQTAFAVWRIENHGVSGYAGQRNLIQLERNARWSGAEYVTFCWIPDHLRRNVAAINIVQRTSVLAPAGAQQRPFPRAVISPDGSLAYRKIKFPRPDLVGIDLSDFLPDPYYLDLVAAKIFQRAHQIVVEAGGSFFVTTLRGELSRGLASSLEQGGIPVVDASLSGEQYWLSPDDAHPNAAAHQIYAERIGNYLRARENEAPRARIGADGGTG